MQFVTENILIIFILPILAFSTALAIHIAKLWVQNRTILFTSFLASFICLIFSVILFYHFVILGILPVEYSFDWFRIGEYTLSLGVLFDKTSSVFLLLFALICILVQWYSASYMRENQKFNLFFAYLNMLVFSVQGLILSSNIIQTYIFLELTGVCCYLLMNLDCEKYMVSKFSEKMFVIDKIGDLMFLSGIVVLFYYLITYSIPFENSITAYSEIGAVAADFYVYCTDAVFYIVCFLFFCAVIAKTAQFPIHIWLADSFETPIPANAFMQSICMSGVGIYIALRLLPLFEYSHEFMLTMVYVGVITAFMCSFFALGQNNIIKMLSYSTSSQLGLIIIGLGILSPASSLNFLISHSFAKASLLLIAGIIVAYITYESKDMEDMHGLRKQYPILAICYLVSVISISAFYFGCFWGQKDIFAATISSENIFLIVLLVLTTFMTAFCLFKSYFGIFEGATVYDEKKNVSFNVYCPVIILSVLTIAATFIPQNMLIDFKPHFLQKNCLLQPNSVFIFAYAAVIGAVLAYYIVSRNIKIFPVLLGKFAYNGGYITKIYEFVAEISIEVIKNIFSLFDKYVICALEKIQAGLTKLISSIVYYSQNGSIQTYLAYAAFSVGFILLLYLVFTIIVGFGVM